MSIKALAAAVLQRNKQGNQREIRSLLPSKLKESEQLHRKLDTAPPQWQYDFCIAHAEFNHCRGSCPCSIDDCLIGRVIDSGGDIDKLRGLEIGQGVTTGMVVDEWLDAGESVENLLENPTWLICMAEHQRMGGGNKLALF